MAEVDKNQSGAIDFDEFVHMMTTKFGERDSIDELSKAFKIIDHDNNVKSKPYPFLNILFIYSFEVIPLCLTWNFFGKFQGKISHHDIKQIAKELGENFTDNDIEEMIEEADRDSKWKYI